MNIQITEVNSTKVNISWNALPVCSQGADGLRYELVIKRLGSKKTLKNYARTTSFIFMEILYFQRYQVTIIPINSEGKGEPSRTSLTPQGRKCIVN